MFPSPRETVVKLLADCDITLNGSRPTDLRVRNERFFTRVLVNGSLGLGESYVDGWWDVDDLDGFVSRLLAARLDERIRTWREVASFLAAALFNLQRPSRAFQVGQRHYDIGNDLYEKMLDRRMIYSCGYWASAATLDEPRRPSLTWYWASGLRAGQSVLDIGCGWGGALKYAVEKHQVIGTGLTVSREQADHARAACRGLPVTILLQDYRDLHESFDQAFSIGMFEHVGPKNYRTYMQTVHRCLNAGGRFLLHTIGSLRETANHMDPWIGKYIFPNAIIPSQRQSPTRRPFAIEGWQRIGSH